MHTYTRRVDLPTFEGWPPAFEAAVRLGRAREVFCLYIEADTTTTPTLWVCSLERTRGRKVGRGSHGKRRWREWWRKHGIVPDDVGTVRTDWFRHDTRLESARQIGLQIYEASKLPDNVHILEADAPARPRHP